MPRDDATLIDILRAARQARSFAGRVTKTEFFDDLQLQSSVLYQLVIIGEGVRRLSDEFRATHGNIPWRQIAGMRDHLVHAYDALDLDEVWNTMQRDVPRLIKWIESYAPRPPAEPE